MIRHVLLATALFVCAASPAFADSEATLQKRLDKIESLMANASEYQQYLLLDTAARTAFELDLYNKAHGYAERLLELSAGYRNDWNYGNATHHGHIVLGKIAFIIDDLPTAKRQLLAAGSSPGSEAIRKFGPDMQLAMHLLQKGEAATVIRYLEMCRGLWPDGEQQLDAWITDIEAGGTPMLLNGDARDQNDAAFTF